MVKMDLYKTNMKHLKLLIHVKADVPAVCIVNVQLHYRCPHETAL